MRERENWKCYLYEALERVDAIFEIGWEIFTDMAVSFWTWKIEQTMKHDKMYIDGEGWFDAPWKTVKIKLKILFPRVWKINKKGNIRGNLVSNSIWIKFHGSS